jgi:hypothetical protein
LILRHKNTFKSKTLAQNMYQHVCGFLKGFCKGFTFAEVANEDTEVCPENCILFEVFRSVHFSYDSYQQCKLVSYTHAGSNSEGYEAVGPHRCHSLMEGICINPCDPMMKRRLNEHDCERSQLGNGVES